MTALFALSFAVSISEMPFNGAVASVKVDLEDDRRVLIYHKDIVNKTKEMIETVTREVEEGYL